MHKRIFLIGFMGSGKSTLGARLARKIGYEFLDMDQLIEETAGMTIPGIFSEHGEAVFRKWEHDILLELCQKEDVVISTGGGAPCHGEMMSIMKDHGSTVYLKLSPEALKERLIHSRTERPLIREKTDSELLDYITEMLHQREFYYNQASMLMEGLNPDLNKLVKILEAH